MNLFNGDELMYKYFKEVEIFDKFKTYLKKSSFDLKRDRVVRGAGYSDDILKELSDIFERLELLDMMIEGINEKLLFQSAEYNTQSYEEWFDCSSFFSFREENFPGLKDLKQKIDLDSCDIESIFRDYLIYSRLLINFYPDFKETLSETQNMIKDTMKKIKLKNTIEVPPEKEAVLLNWPNSWYFTPHGYLYNPGCGHKQGNMVYPLYYDIFRRLKGESMVPSVNNHEHIKKILERGYITDSEFHRYANLIYTVPTIVTPEVGQDIELFKKISEMSYADKEKLIRDDSFRFPDIGRSYQRNLITLVVGYLSAETALYSAFTRMNNSKRKSELFRELLELCPVEFQYEKDPRDVLVCYAGFSKIETDLKKTISTTSLNGISEFSEYLKRGWDLQIIPGVVYDQTQDKLSVVDFNSYFVSKHLEKELNKYECSKEVGKGKVFIRHFRDYNEKGQKKYEENK